MIGEAFSSSPLVCVYLHLTKFEFMCVSSENSSTPPLLPATLRRRSWKADQMVLLIEKHNLWKFVSPRKAVY